MPRGDGTGPEGRGPMTGRGMGLCAGFSSLGFTREVPMGRGFGRGYRRNRGYGWRQRPRFVERASVRPVVERLPEMSKKEELNFLKEEKKALEKEIKEITKRLKELG